MVTIISWVIFFHTRTQISTTISACMIFLPNTSLLSISSVALSSSSSGNTSLAVDLLNTSGLALSSDVILINDQCLDLPEDVVAKTAL